MKKELSNSIKFWFELSRAYSFPMSVMSWLIPFTFGVCDGGNVFYGIIALIGILFAHAGTNMFDDFADYLIEKRKIDKGLKTDFNFQKGKCRHLISGSITLKKLLSVIVGCFLIALLCGYYLVLKSGFEIISVIIIAGILALLYPLCSYVALGEVVVGIMFAPLLYFGVYFVMTGTYSFELLPMTVSTGLLTVGLLHAHMLLDFDFDALNKKITLCSLAKSKNNALKTQILIDFFAYFNILGFCLSDNISKIYLISFLSLPTAIILILLLKEDKYSDKKPNILYGPLEKLEEYKQNQNYDFMLKFMVARNVMVEFTMLVCIAKILTEILDVYI